MKPDSKLRKDPSKSDIHHIHLLQINTVDQGTEKKRKSPLKNTVNKFLTSLL